MTIEEQDNKSVSLYGQSVSVATVRRLVKEYIQELRDKGKLLGNPESWPYETQQQFVSSVWTPFAFKLRVGEKR